MWTQLELTGLWRNGDFVRLWAGSTVSEFGTLLGSLSFVAVVMLGASPLQMGILGAVGAVVLIYGVRELGFGTGVLATIFAVGGGWGMEPSSYQPMSCRQDGGAPGSRGCCLIAPVSASILLAVGGGGDGAVVLPANVLPPRWRSSRESWVLPDRPWERQHPAGGGRWWGWRRSLASASILLAVGGGGDGAAVLQANVLPPRWRRSRESWVLPDRPWERQHPAGRGWGMEAPSCKPRFCSQKHHLTIESSNYLVKAFTAAGPPVNGPLSLEG